MSTTADMAAKKKKSKSKDETFADRLARLRTDAGFTQREFARQLGISQRMVAYYETHEDPPLLELLAAMTHALGVSADELLGVVATRNTKRPNQRLWRRLRQLEKLPPKERTQVLSVMDAYLEREKLAKRAG